MANIKSAKKRARQEIVRNLRNTMLRSRVATSIKKARKALVAGVKPEAEATLRLALSQIDKMVPKGIYKKNKAARLKSRLQARFKRMSAAA